MGRNDSTLAVSLTRAPRKNIITIPKFALLPAVLLLAVTSQGCPQSATSKDTRAEDEATIRAYSQAYNAAVHTKNVEESTSFYTDDALSFSNYTPTMTAKEAIRADMQNEFSVPGWTIDWKTSNLIVARSGDLAYEYGRYTSTTTEKDGKIKTHTGNYLLVWRKSPDGDWKIAVDTDAEDPPPAPPTK